MIWLLVLLLKCSLCAIRSALTAPMSSLAVFFFLQFWPQQICSLCEIRGSSNPKSVRVSVKIRILCVFSLCLSLATKQNRNFRPKGEGRSGRRPLLPKRKLNILVDLTLGKSYHSVVTFLHAQKIKCYTFSIQTSSKLISYYVCLWKVGPWVSYFFIRSSSRVSRSNTIFRVFFGFTSGFI